MDHLSHIDNLVSDSPSYNPDLFEDNRQTHNCYDYAINNTRKQDEKTHPGHTKLGNDLDGSDVHSCAQMETRLGLDHPELEKIDYHLECPKGKYKIGMMVDPNEDYHFIRQDKNGNWSHKPGSSVVRNTDFSNKLMTDPTKADFNYRSNGLNYTKKCGFYCVAEPHKN
jgi:hypothetical protein